jgi:hypothetical protein
MSNYLSEQQKKFEEFAENYRKETNEVFRELVRQLILVATVFLSISAFVFYIKDLIIKFSIFDKHCLMISWTLIGLSIIFGIIQIIIDYYFFRRWSNAKFYVADRLYIEHPKDEDIDKIAYDEQKGIPNSSTTLFVWLQVFFLIIGIILLVFIMSKSLF